VHEVLVLRRDAARAMLTLLMIVQVLEDVVEYEITAEGTRETHLEQILLNGNNIALLVGWHPP
jgi:hypothetical protein